MKIRLPLSLRAVLLACMSAGASVTAYSATLTWYGEYTNPDNPPTFIQKWWQGDAFTGSPTNLQPGDNTSFGNVNPSNDTPRQGQQTVEFVEKQNYGEFLLDSNLEWIITTAGSTWTSVSIKGTGTGVTFTDGIETSGNLTATGNTTILGDAVVGGTLTQASGTLSAKNLRAGSLGTINRINLSGMLTTSSWGLASGGTITASSFNGREGSADLKLTQSTTLILTGNEAVSLDSLTIDKGSSLSYAADLDVANAFTVSGTLTDQDHTITVANGPSSITGTVEAGSLTISNGTLTTGTNTKINLTGQLSLADWTLGAGTITAKSLSADGVSTLVLAGTKLTLTGSYENLTWGSLSISSQGWLNTNATPSLPQTITINGDLSIASGSTWDARGTQTGAKGHNIIVSGDASILGKIWGNSLTLNGDLTTGSGTTIGLTESLSANSWTLGQGTIIAKSLTTNNTSALILNGTSLTLSGTDSMDLLSLAIESNSTFSTQSDLAIVNGITVAGTLKSPNRAITVTNGPSSITGTVEAGSVTISNGTLTTDADTKINLSGQLSLADWTLGKGSITANTLGTTATSVLQLTGTKLQLSGNLGNFASLTLLDGATLKVGQLQVPNDAKVTVTIGANSSVYGGTVNITGTLHNDGEISSSGPLKVFGNVEGSGLISGQNNIVQLGLDDNSSTTLTGNGSIQSSKSLTVYGDLSLGIGSNDTKKLHQAATAGGDITVTGTLETQGIVSSAQGNIQVTGATTLTGDNASLIATSQTADKGAITTGALDIRNKGEVHADKAITINGDLQNNGTILSNTGDIVINGTVALGADAILRSGDVYEGPDTVIEQGGDITITSDTTLGAGSVLSAANGTLTLGGTLTTTGSNQHNVTIVAHTLKTNNPQLGDLSLLYTDLTLTDKRIYTEEEGETHPAPADLTFNNIDLDGSTFTTYSGITANKVTLKNGSTLESFKENYFFNGSDADKPLGYQNYIPGQTDLSIDFLSVSGTNNVLTSYGNILLKQTGSSATDSLVLASTDVTAWGWLHLSNGGLTLGDGTNTAHVQAAGTKDGGTYTEAITINGDLTVNKDSSLTAQSHNGTENDKSKISVGGNVEFFAAPEGGKSIFATNDIVIGGNVIGHTGGKMEGGQRTFSDDGIKIGGYANLDGAWITSGKQITVNGTNHIDGVKWTFHGDYDSNNPDGVAQVHETTFDNVAALVRNQGNLIAERGSLTVNKGKLVVLDGSTVTATSDITVLDDNIEIRNDAPKEGPHPILTVTADNTIRTHYDMIVAGDNIQVNATNIYVFDNASNPNQGTLFIHGDNVTVSAQSDTNNAEARAWKLAMHGVGNGQANFIIGNGGLRVDNETFIAAASQIKSTGSITFNGTTNMTNGTVFSQKDINITSAAPDTGLTMTGGILNATGTLKIATAQAEVTGGDLKADVLDLNQHTSISKSTLTVGQTTKISANGKDADSVTLTDITGDLGFVNISGSGEKAVDNIVNISQTSYTDTGQTLMMNGMDISNASVNVKASITGHTTPWWEFGTHGDRLATTTLHNNGYLTLDSGVIWQDNIDLQDNSTLTLGGATITGNLSAEGTSTSGNYSINLDVTDGGTVKGDVNLKGLNITGNTSNKVQVLGFVDISESSPTVDIAMTYFNMAGVRWNGGTHLIEKDLPEDGSTTIFIVENGASVTLGTSGAGGAQAHLNGDVRLRYGVLNLVNVKGEAASGTIYFEDSSSLESKIQRTLSVSTDARANDIIMLADGTIYVAPGNTLTVAGELRGDADLTLTGGGNKVFNHKLTGGDKDYTGDILWQGRHLSRRQPVHRHDGNADHSVHKQFDAQSDQPKAHRHGDDRLEQGH